MDPLDLSWYLKFLYTLLILRVLLLSFCFLFLTNSIALGWLPKYCVYLKFLIFFFCLYDLSLGITHTQHHAQLFGARDELRALCTLAMHSTS